MVHCNKRGSEALLGDCSHIFKYEQGGAAHLGGVLLSTLRNKPDGTFDLKEMESRIRGFDIHEPVTNLVAVENTHNYCGGKVLPMTWLDELADLCKKHSIPIHMDGARLFNACEYLGEKPSNVVKHCASVSVCFSKGLCAPAGSALAGSYHFIEQARRLRRMLGGAMRQVGVLAAPALVALDEIVPLLGFDHKRAFRLAKVIEGLFLDSFAVDVENLHTNIVLVRISENSPLTSEVVLQRLMEVCQSETMNDCKTENNDGVIVRGTHFNDKTLRFILHHDITDEDLWLAIMKITYVFKELDKNKQAAKKNQII
ncbi:probable low-specificity L-threonine aldolase 2 [Hyposmocoma kahamanoa]|uniref:probable low-specificity L-threonine aldolase 2 n=1 Tax=Hyposmocoma kahamanoa TaxID=1477025 RepID=UPI000E6D7746|nr:probable low-specificity L-threonine aldolase 2 [Hyposmocoma kahamanoa]